MQMFIIQLTSLKQKINIDSIYFSPTYFLKRNNFKPLLNELGDRFILGGDFNAKHVDWGVKSIFNPRKRIETNNPRIRMQLSFIR